MSVEFKVGDRVVWSSFPIMVGTVVDIKGCFWKKYEVEWDNENGCRDIHRAKKLDLY